MRCDASGGQLVIKIGRSHSVAADLYICETSSVQAPSRPHMTILKAHFATGAEFLEQYLPALPSGGIFFPTRRPLAIGEPVVVSIRLGKRRSPMLLRGHVVWRRPGKHRTKTKAGIGIEFLPTEGQTRDYLVAVARGDSAEMIARRHQRLPVELPVTWQVPGALQDNSGILRDIGRGGAFVKS